MKTIGIVGSRRRSSANDMVDCMAALDIYLAKHKISEYRLVSGGCPKGADNFAESIAKTRGLTIIIHYPNWAGLGKAAGFARNTKIAEDCDVLIALVAEDRTGGTEDTIRKATKLGKEIILVGKVKND